MNHLTSLLLSLLLFPAMLLAQPQYPNRILQPNTPCGTPRGIHPGRVAWTHAPGAATWTEGAGHWYDDEYNNQDLADWMVSEAIRTLTGEKSDTQAWQMLFVSFNETHNRGKHGYRPGEKIAIKANMNNSYGYEDSGEINASPHMLLALLRSLVYEGGVAQECITLFDASRFMTNSIYLKCHAEFPRVRYVDNEGGEGRIKAEYVENAIPYSVDNGQLARGLATCAIEADYLINMALLKGHVGQGVTLCGKNWYGVTSIHRDWRKNHHNNFGQDPSGKMVYNTFVDFMAHKDLGEKTMLFLIDGLYGSRNVAGLPAARWQLAPFNGDWPCSLLASQDGVAIDAVAVDLLLAEYPDMPDVNYCDMYLVEAAMANAPLSGTVYDPERDGTPVQRSLGVAERWNNPNDKHYSLIDLIYRRK